MGARLLIDDSVDNALVCAAAGFPVLLYGDYPWGQRLSPVSNSLDKFSFAARRALDSSNWWEKERVVLPEKVWRVHSWKEAVRWIQSHMPSLAD